MKSRAKLATTFAFGATVKGMSTDAANCLSLVPRRRKRRQQCIGAVSICSTVVVLVAYGHAFIKPLLLRDAPTTLDVFWWVGHSCGIVALLATYACINVDPGLVSTLPPAAPDEERKPCPVCGLARPPNSHHCRVCGVCVVGFDHHCGFLGTCIARGNHRYFVLLLSTAALILPFFLFNLVVALGCEMRAHPPGALADAAYLSVKYGICAMSLVLGTAFVGGFCLLQAALLATGYTMPTAWEAQRVAVSAFEERFVAALSSALVALERVLSPSGWRAAQTALEVAHAVGDGGNADADNNTVGRSHFGSLWHASGTLRVVIILCGPLGFELGYAFVMLPGAGALGGAGLLLALASAVIVVWTTIDLNLRPELQRPPAAASAPSAPSAPMSCACCEAATPTAGLMTSGASGAACAVVCPACPVATPALHATADEAGRAAEGEAGEAGEAWCAECKAPQSPYAAHCRKCGTCVDGHDHHCGLLGCCVGEHNRRRFAQLCAASFLGSLPQLLHAGHALVGLAWQVWDALAAAARLLSTEGRLPPTPWPLLRSLALHGAIDIPLGSLAVAALCFGAQQVVYVAWRRGVLEAATPDAPGFRLLVAFGLASWGPMGAAHAGRSRGARDEGDQLLRPACVHVR